MVALYTRLCEQHSKNFNDVPSKFQEAVKNNLEKDGYIILPDGTVEKANSYE